MSIIFNGTTINGVNVYLVAGSPEFRASRTHHWGVHGETEIVSKPGGRTITGSILHYDDYDNIEDLLVGLETFDALVGTNGLLEDDTIDAGAPFPASTSATQYPNTTLERFDMTTFGSQETPGPLLDEAGCLDGKWYVHLEFTFRQLLTLPNGRAPALP